MERNRHPSRSQCFRGQFSFGVCSRCRSLISLFGGIRNSHSNAMIAGGSTIHTCAPRSAVLRRQVSHPSRQSHPSSSWKPTPLQRATSFAKDAEQGDATNDCPAASWGDSMGLFGAVMAELGRSPQYRGGPASRRKSRLWMSSSFSSVVLACHAAIASRCSRSRQSLHLPLVCIFSASHFGSIRFSLRT